MFMKNIYAINHCRVNRFRFPALILLLIFTIYSCEFIGSDMVEIADNFFKAAKDDNFTEAYSFVSEEFKKSTSQDELEQFLKSGGFIDYSSSSWHSRKFENNQGTIEGTIKTVNGGEIPLTIYFIKENEEWKILRINIKNAGVENQTAQTGELIIPSDEDIKELAKKSVYDLAVAIQANDFGAFYGNISKLWQGQTTSEELKNVFNDFIVKKIDLRYVNEIEPVISSKPYINEQNLLVFDGYFTGNLTTYFSLKYTYEHPFWKLIGISVNTK